MVPGHATAERGLQFIDSGLEVAMGQRRQGLGHGLAGDQCLDNAASAEAQDVGHHRVQLDVGILQRLLDALNVAGAFTHHLLAGAQQVAHLLGGFIGHEAGLDQSMCHQVGQPDRIVDVGFATRHVLHVGGVGQDQFELAVGQNVPDRLPIDARRFHGDVRGGLGGKPLRQGHQLLGGCLESLDMGCDLAFDHVTNAGHYRVLMHIQTGAMRM